MIVPARPSHKDVRAGDTERRRFYGTADDGDRKASGRREETGVRPCSPKPCRPVAQSPPRTAQVASSMPSTRGAVCGAVWFAVSGRVAAVPEPIRNVLRCLNSSALPSFHWFTGRRYPTTRE